MDEHGWNFRFTATNKNLNFLKVKWEYFIPLSHFFFYLWTEPGYVSCNSFHRFTQAQSRWMRSISKTIFKPLQRLFFFFFNMTEIWPLAQLLRTFTIPFWQNSMEYLAVWYGSLSCWNINLCHNLNFPAFPSTTTLKCLAREKQPMV